MSANLSPICQAVDQLTLGYTRMSPLPSRLMPSHRGLPHLSLSSRISLWGVGTGGRAQRESWLRCCSGARNTANVDHCPQLKLWLVRRPELSP
jgi:hypothetical protein